MKRLLLAAVAASVVAAALPVHHASAQTMRIGLREDPDILDPTLARTYVGRIVFASLCDKLFDIDKDLNIVPQLATGFKWDDSRTLTITLREGVKFHDGETMDANAVAYSLNRHLTMQGSFRRGEINAMDRVEVVDPKTVRIHLKVAFAPFLAQLTDRAGMVVSPKAAEAAGRDFGLKPVCAGPFRFVERVAQDRIVVERFPDYWDKENVHLDRIIYLPIPDSTVRLANLQSGALELTETISATDIPAVQRNPRLRVAMGDELGSQSITFNIANGDRAKAPIGQHAKVRQAFDLAIDRATIIQVVYDGHFAPTAQAVPPSSPYYVRSLAPPTRDVARARALLREAGVATPVKVELTVPNNPDMRQVGEVIQAMAAEAGFEV
ncbi:MAG: ABC transporter substrate-binding protein [Burkholderiales bacterium]|nr:ABC transporter substrate-binding protein [Burkholderiales bacterium]